MLAKFTRFLLHMPKINEAIRLIFHWQVDEIPRYKVLESSADWRNELGRKWWLLSCLYFTCDSHVKPFLKTVNFGSMLLAFLVDLSKNVWRLRILWSFYDVLEHQYSKSQEVGNSDFPAVLRVRGPCVRRPQRGGGEENVGNEVVWGHVLSPALCCSATAMQLTCNVTVI